MGFATNAIHVGQEPDPATGAIVAPIYQISASSGRVQALLPRRRITP